MDEVTDNYPVVPPAGGNYMTLHLLKQLFSATCYGFFLFNFLVFLF